MNYTEENIAALRREIDACGRATICPICACNEERIKRIRHLQSRENRPCFIERYDLARSAASVSVSTGNPDRVNAFFTSGLPPGCAASEINRLQQANQNTVRGLTERLQSAEASLKYVIDKNINLWKAREAALETQKKLEARVERLSKDFWSVVEQRDTLRKHNVELLAKMEKLKKDLTDVTHIIGQNT